MPTSSTAATVDKKKGLRLLTQKSTDPNLVNAKTNTEKQLLKIAPALPFNNRRSLYVRSHSTLNAASISKAHDGNLYDCVALQTGPDGILRVSRTQNEKENHPDRISLDRRGLTHIPFIDGEPRLRLLSLQHNLIIDLEMLCKQKFPTLVFLDVYDNQLEQIKPLDILENLRVLLMGKNRIKKIEGIESLKKLEVLDLHGNQIGQVTGLANLSELKVLNLAGNQIRVVGAKDLQGLESLQELNLRRNRLRKLLGCGELNSLVKLFLSNNDLQSVEDISSIAKSPNVREICIDNNPVFMAGDCVSFLVSYLPHLIKLNTMQITEQVRKAAMAWRRNKETTNAAFMDLTSETTLHYRREEVISNARTNWELIRSQTKCLTNNVTTVEKSVKNLKPDSDFILTSLSKPSIKPAPQKSKSFIRISSKVPLLPDKKLNLARAASQDTENSQNTTSSSVSNEFLKLPPILLPIISKLEKSETTTKDDNSSLKHSGSLSSVGPNIDSSSSMASGSDAPQSSSSSSSTSDSSDSESEQDGKDKTKIEQNSSILPLLEKSPGTPPTTDTQPHNPPIIDNNNPPSEDTSSNLSANTTNSISMVSNNSESDKGSTKSSSNSNSGVTRNVKSAAGNRSLPLKCNGRAATAKAKKVGSPIAPKDREQGGDYLIEICGRHLNVYGQGALRFIDKPWNASKANDVNTIKFNYVNFNSIIGSLTKIKHRFPNADHFVFKETNIACIGQLNAIAEVQGLISLTIDSDGNPISEKPWRSYAIYRLAHWGLKIINEKEITEDDIKQANKEYQSLSDLVLWSLPDVLLQPLLVRLRIDINHGVTEQNAKKWLLKADPELKSVVSKEALQWKKGSVSQDDLAMRQKAKQHISSLFDDMTNAMNKLKILDQDWPQIMHEFVQNTLLDYSQLDMYMKQKIQELNK